MTALRRALVIGFGSMGRRRTAALRALGLEVAVLRRSASGAATGLTTFATREEAHAWAPDAVVVCSPTSCHFDDVRWALQRGRHVLVEKPLAASVREAEELVALADRSGLCLAVGYNLRFHPAMETIHEAVTTGRIGRLLCTRLEVGQHLPDWHPDQDYRDSYVARAQLGGGALLTLSHEIDLALWVGGRARTARGVARRVSGLDIDVDDVAEVLLEHESGALSSVHLDLLDRTYHRRSRWIGDEATLAWQWGGPVRLQRDDRDEVLWHDPGFTVGATAEPEVGDFVTAAAGGAPPRADGRAGLAVLEACAGVEVRM